MPKTIINATEGGAKIKGCIQMPLREALKEYCDNPIDKSYLIPLLTLADDSETLISRVIPLLEQDIENLETIIKNSRKGMATNSGILKLLRRIYKSKKKKLITQNDVRIFNKLTKESVEEGQGNFIKANHYFYEKLLKIYDKKNILWILIKLSKNNFEFSEQAHIKSATNPLVNVAIYGASRAIQSRRLKVDETLISFLKDKKIAETRIERNNLILSTARKASESLLKSYKETLELLKKYNETKDDEFLRPIVNEEINLDDAEQYFEAGNWAHPYIDSKKILDTLYNSSSGYTEKDYDKANAIFRKANKLREEAIEKAIDNEYENGEKESNLLKHNALLERSQEEGKKENFEEALRLIKKAQSLIPDSQEVRWGMATCLDHLDLYDESIKKYKELIENQPEGLAPENPRFRFEMGQVMLKVPEMIINGLREISKAMEQTNEFDSFLFHIGEIYTHLEMYDEAIEAYASYIERFPFDFNALEKHGDCLSQLGRNNEAEISYRKAKQIRVD